MHANHWQIERRADGAIIVRVPSQDRDGQPLPDAVFAFRVGDYQYAKWDQCLRQREAQATNGNGHASGHAPLETFERRAV